MKRKILLFLALVSVIACFLVVSISAETPSDYIEFGARFEGSDDYITVYTVNAGTDGNPRVNLNGEFYTDVEFTNKVDLTQATGIDFSVAKAYGTNTPTNRITAPSTPFVKCTEVKWFKEGFTQFWTTKVFKGWTSLKSFDFGCLTSIGDNCFENTGFETLVIPSAITSFSNSVFYNCQNLQTVKFEGNLTSLGISTFQNCSSLKSIDLGNLTFVSNKMFRDCIALENINLSNITKINNEAFYGCKALVIVDAGNVTSFGDSCFRNCTSLEGIDISSAVTISGNAFRDCSALKSIVIPATVTTMGGYVFKDCTSLESAELNASIGVIPAYTFSGCTKLSNLEILSTTYTEIGSYAFYGTAITEFHMPDTVTTLGQKVFQACSKLEKVTLSNNVTVLQQDLLRGCASLTELVLPANLVSIGNYGINGCSGVKTIVIPKSFTTFGQDSTNSVNPTKIIYTGSADDEVIETIKSKFPNAEIVFENHCDTYFDGAHTVEAYEYIFTAFTEDTKLSGVCTVCQLEDVKESYGPIVVIIGASYSDNDIMYNYSVNKVAIDAYIASGRTLSFGVVVALGDVTSPLNADGSLTEGTKGYASDLTERGNDLYEIAVKGIPAEHLATSIVCCGYITDGTTLHYMGATALESAATPVTLEALIALTPAEIKEEY